MNSVKKITLIFLFPIVCSNLVYAQKNNFVVEDGILSVTGGYSDPEFKFEKYDNEALIKKFEINDVAIKGKVKKDYFSSLGFLKFGETIYFYYALFDKDLNTDFLFARQVNIEKGGFIGEPIELIKVPGKVDFISAYVKFIINESSDHSKLIIRYKHRNDKRNNTENKVKFGIAVFNEGIEKIWSNDVQMPCFESECSVSDFEVDSKGKGYFLLKKSKEQGFLTPRESKEQVEIINNSHFEIFEVTKEGKGEVKEFKLEDGNVVQSIALQENSIGDMVCIGYYSKPMSNEVYGLFSIILSKDGKLSKINMHEFSAEFVQQYTKKSEKDKEQKFKNLNLDNVSTLSDGGILIRGEISYSVPRKEYNIYFFDDIILTKINVQGEVEWIKKIPKNSRSRSLDQFIDEEYVYICFLDNTKNKNLGNDDTPFITPYSYRDDDPEFGALISYKINLKDGEHEYKTLLNKITEIEGTPVIISKIFNGYELIRLSETKFVIDAIINLKYEQKMFQIEMD